MKEIKLEDFPNPKERYGLEDCIGSGAFGKVYAAIDNEVNCKNVAIKIQKITKNTRRYIEQEYKILRDATSHSNLPDFYGIYQKNEEIWFVMEICEGNSVLDLIHGLQIDNRRMNEEQIAYILKETVKAVIFLHENCIIHRDIKAKNILLTKNGEVKLVDFGFSANLNNVLEKINGSVGSPNWMAPEVITCGRNKEKYDNRIDVWSIGITSIELGDGKVPYYSMHPTRILFQIVANPPPKLYRPQNWTENYVDFVNECLVKKPEHRPYASELLDHPFLNQIPENNYHLALEIKLLISSLSKLDLPKAECEVAVVNNYLKRGFEGDLELMLLEDLAALDQINEQNVLKLLEARMEKNLFQTYVGDALLVLNPNEKMENFGEVYHENYRSKSRSENAPHIYAVADSAYQYALHHQIPQRIILSGESGSGKTTNYLHLVNHLLYLGQNTCINFERIKDAIKLIHSLTHASTPINNYSTRCIFKTDIKYGSTGKVTAAVFNIYQLEKWRISSVDMFQGNYHFLYYIYDGLYKNKKLEQYQLNGDRQYRYLRISVADSTESPKCNIGQNLTKFKKILKIFEDFGMNDEQIDTIFSIVAAILIIGEIRFEESESEGAIIENIENIEKIAYLLKIEASKLSWSLTNYCLVRKGAVVRRKTTADEARDARDVLANNLYARLVDYLVAVINYKLSSGRKIFGDKYSVQVFDYFGFECIKTNHLPELFVNCFNEQLHYHYLQRVFAWEYLDIIEEEIDYQPFSYYDNKSTLNELLSKSEGLFSVIDDASKTGHGGQYIINFLHKTEKEYVDVTRTSEFSVAHYTGKVYYCVTEMAEKNRDFLPPEVIETIRLSDNSLIKMLFTNKLNKTGNLIVDFEKNEEKRRYRLQTEKLEFQYSQIKRIRTAIHTFKAISLELLKELSVGSGSGGTHFVRCVRTNLKGEPGKFDYRLVKQQVRALAVTETAKTRQKGYPHRISFQEFLRRYRFLAFDFDENVDMNKENCRLLLIRLQMEGWDIGKSKVFLKYYNEEYLARLYETHVKKVIKIQSILRRFLAKCLVAKEMSQKKVTCVSTLGKKKLRRRMTEEEAAFIIQRAYRESTIKKSYADFAKDYKILDEETCEFIRSYADKWRKNSLFHVLVLYRAMNFQDLFNFSQQVHFYNIGVFYELHTINKEIPLESIDSRALASQWLQQVSIPTRKIPFRLDEIPYYDTFEMCNSLLNPGVSVEKSETWDTPYRWRELVSSKTVPPGNLTRVEENLINTPYTRDPSTPVRELLDIDESEDTSKHFVKIVVEEIVTKKEKNDENEVRKITEEKINIPSKIPKKDIEVKVNSNTKPANKDFDYIRPATKPKPKSADPVAELTKNAQRNSSDDDPPFNFQGMLRKTNFKKEPMKEVEQKPFYSLKKRQENVTLYNENDSIDRVNEKNSKNKERKKDYDNKMNGYIEEDCLLGKEVRVELAPGVILEGIEVQI